MVIHSVFRVRVIQMINSYRHRSIWSSYIVICRSVIWPRPRIRSLRSWGWCMRYGVKGMKRRSSPFPARAGCSPSGRSVCRASVAPPLVPQTPADTQDISDLCLSERQHSPAQSRRTEELHTLSCPFFQQAIKVQPSWQFSILQIILWSYLFCH